MKKSILLIFLIILLSSCTIPQAQSSTKKVPFNYQNLSQDMLSETIWCGRMSATIMNNPQKEVYLAAYFLNGKAGVARGKTPEEAAGMAVYRVLYNQGICKIEGSSVIVPDFWDGSYGLGRVSAKIDFNNNNEATIKIFIDNVNSDIVYETKNAVQIDGYTD